MILHFTIFFTIIAIKILLLYKRRELLYNYKMKIILASGSPRRCDLLKNAGFDFTVIKSGVSENISKNLPPHVYAQTLAEMKGRDVFYNLLSDCDRNSAVTVSADTVVYFKGEYLLKPRTPEEAESYLKKLSANTHEVYTGYFVLCKSFSITSFEKTLVTFNPLSDDLIKRYIASEKYVGKAGGYGIQDGFPLVKTIDGDYLNVVGLPVEKIKNILNGILKYEK